MTTLPTINSDQIMTTATHACSRCRRNPIRSVSFWRESLSVPIICFRVDLCETCFEGRPVQLCRVCEAYFPDDNCNCASCFTERTPLDTYQICHSCLFIHRMRHTDVDVYANREVME